jgi:hypothetical protein
LQGWPLGRLATCAAGLAVLVAFVFVWLTLADVLGSRSPGDHTQFVDPFAHETAH